MKKAVVLGVLLLAFIIASCSGEKPGDATSEITIEPYNMSEQESLLISKTGVEHIRFFKLNGTLGEEDDLEISIEVYEDGKFKEELLKTWDALENNFKGSLISFGMSDFQKGDDSVKSYKLISGIPSGLATTNYSTTVTASSIGNLIGDKIALKKNEPIYLAAWAGTTKNTLRSIGKENGELPEGIGEYETALVYKVVWTDKDRE